MTTTTMGSTQTGALRIAIAHFTICLAIFMIFTSSSGLISNFSSASGTPGVLAALYQDTLPILVPFGLILLFHLSSTVQSEMPGQVAREFHHIIPIGMWSTMALFASWMLWATNSPFLSLMTFSAFAIQLWNIYRAWALAPR